MVTTISGFLFCAVVIFIAGRNLSRYGDILSEHLGLGRAFIGMILIASVTSLPELTVGITSVTVLSSPDLALGDIMGSCAFNLGILALLDVFVRGRSVFSELAGSHTLAAAMGIVLISLVGYGLYEEDSGIAPWIGLTSVLFLFIYVISMAIIRKYEQRETVAPAESHTPSISLPRAAGLYALNAAVVIAAAIFLPGFAEEIGEHLGLGESFVGTLFLAASTSFPEIAVSYSALRMGMVDMAVGNLLGSNLFNILILAVDDLFYQGGILLNDASDSNLISVFAVVIMTAIAITGMTYRVRSKRFLMAWDALAIFGVYVLNLVLLYQAQH